MATQNQKSKESIEKLKATIKNSPYIPLLEQHSICKELGLTYKKALFSNEYKKRFYNFLFNTTTTVAAVSKATNIPHKLLCQYKRYYEKRDKIEVVFLGECPSTGSKNVQFLSTNPLEWNKSEYQK